MGPRLLMDTHVLVRSMIEPKRLSQKQSIALQRAVGRGEPVAFSAISLLEVAVLSQQGKIKLKKGLEEFFADIQNNSQLRLLPLDFAIAADVVSLEVLRDPADRVVTATARVHGLRLVTSDNRIIDSGLVAVID